MVFNIFEYISEDMRREKEENQRLIKEAIEKYGDLEPMYYDEDGFLRHRTIFLGKTKKYANNTLGQVVNDGVVIEDYYSKYGKGFSRKFIDKMLSDKIFQKALVRTKLNEGGYVNHENDRGGQTNMGITEKYYPNEDIKNLTRERATAILYRDYWLKYKINTLPKEISDIVFDDAVVQGQTTAIRNLQKALKVKADGIIGSKTINALKGVNYKKIKKIFSDNANTVEDAYQKNDPTQKVFEKGHRNRYNGYLE